MIELYLSLAPAIRGWSYLALCLFLLVWSAYSFHARNYHRASIKFLFGVLLVLFANVAVSPDARVTNYIITPILLILAVDATWFLARLTGLCIKVKRWVGYGIYSIRSWRSAG